MKKEELPGSKELYVGPRKTLYFANHSTVADLFLIEHITGANANSLGTSKIWITCPICAFCSKLNNAGWYVSLGMRTQEEIQKFWRYLDGMFDFIFTHRRHLLAFPEGKRTLTPYTLKLKRGMIGYAFT